MANTSLTILGDSTTKLVIPKHAQKMFEEHSNIDERIMTPSLTYEGKTWQINKDGEKQKLVKRDPDTGDEAAISTMRVVVLSYAKRRGRAYYEGAYDPKKPGSPNCWSDDGEKPEDEVKEKQSATCATCPMSAKGSKQTEQGTMATACGQHRILVVAPTSNVTSQPLRLKIAITSDFDGRNPEAEKQGWYGFSNLTKLLSERGVAHTAALSIKMKFDVNVAYPKIVFAVDRWLDETETAKVIPIVKSAEVASLLEGAWTPDGQPKKAFVAGPKEPTPEGPALVIPPDDDDEDVVIPAKVKDDTAEKAAAAAAKLAVDKAAKIEEAKARAKKAQDDIRRMEAGEDPDADEPLTGEVIAPEPVKPPKATKPKAAAATKTVDVSTVKSSTEVPPDVSGILADWGSDD